MDTFDNVAAFDPEQFRTDDGALREYNRHIIAEFRANSGRVGGVFDGYHVVLLTATGAKSAEPRLTALVALEIGDELIVVGSRGGASSHPAWVFNLRANPRARVEIGEEAYVVNAREVVGVEREKLWPQVVAQVPHFGTYQAATARILPLFALRRA
jgi:deazaflavin-dependent oxidoreductase (nitroreductase family)